MNEIEKNERLDRKERENVKSMGGKRIQIEDTDGSENEEDYEEKAVKIGSDNEAALKPVQIAEVESDDGSQSEEDKEKRPNEPPKEVIKEEIKFELDPKLVEEKDKANREYRNGQYGDAIRHFTHVIDELTNRSKYCSSKTFFKTILLD